MWKLRTCAPRSLRFLLVLALLCAAVPAAAEDGRPTLAVLYFDYGGKDEQLAVLRKGLAQMLISDLSGGTDAVRLVERDRLEDILAELKLGQSGKMDPKSAARVGKLLGARFMVLGSYFDLMGALRADARLVEVETGKVLRSVGVTGQPGDFLSLEQKLYQALGQVITSSVPAQRPAAMPDRPDKADKGQLAKRERPRPPAQLKTKTAVLYSQALDAKDRGDKAGAKAGLQAVVKEQPDFRLAALDLDRLMQ